MSDIINTPADEMLRLLQEKDRRIAELEAELANQRSTIEAWNHAEIMKCGCKYNKVWGGTEWQHWFVPCKEHNFKDLEAELQQARQERDDARLDEAASDEAITNLEVKFLELKEWASHRDDQARDLESKLQEAEAALRDIAKLLASL